MNWLGVLQEAFMAWRTDGAQRLSASLAFYALLSLAPLVVIGVATAQLILGPQQFQQAIVQQVTTLLGPPAHDITETLLDNAFGAYWHGSSALAVLAGLGFLFFAGSAVIHELTEALDIVWGVYHGRRGGLRRFALRRLVSFAMVLGLAFLALVSLLLSVALSSVGTFVSGHLGLPLWLLSGFDVLVNLIFVGLTFTLLYKILPDTLVRWRFVWPGALLAAVLFTASKWLIGVYIGRSAVASAYGTAGSLVVFLLWIYVAAQIFLFGAELGKVLARRSTAP